MEKTFDLYRRGIAYWYLLLIPLIAWGFYRSYFSVLFAPRASIIHLHFAFMMVWAAMLMTQPLLIRYKKLAIHRMIGKTSYVVMPLLLITGFFLIRFIYYRDLKALGRQGSADNVRITIFYLFWLGFFYFRAILNRKRTSIHARYMVAASLTMLGPTVDRIWFFTLGIEKFFGVIPIEYFAFLLQDIILSVLLIYDYRKGKPTKVLWLCLLIYAIGQLLYFLVQGKDFWQIFVSFIMQPAP